MKRAITILLFGAALGLLAAATTYLWLTAPHRAILKQDQPELAWLQKEFQLDPDDFARIAQLHQAYLPRCADLCERIAHCESRIRTLLEQADRVTPEIEQLLVVAAQTRVECQKNMLEHFLEVSRAMPPEQGRRYLSWVREKTFHMDHESSRGTGASHGNHPHH